MGAKTYDVLAMGRSSIDLYSNDIGAPFAEIKSFAAYVGGCPTNISVGTRRLGLRSAVLTGIGEDPVGDFLLRFLEQEGVETRFVFRKPGRRSSAVILGIEPPAKFPLVYYRDNCADIELTIDDVLAAPVADCRVLVISGTGLSREPSRSATLFAAEHARAHGAKVELHAGELLPPVRFIVTNLGTDSRAVVRFYNKRGTAEQWIKEGKQAVKMTRLSCHRFRSNEVRLWLSLITYNLGNLWRRLVLPLRVGNWSLTSLQQRLVKTGGRLIKHARYYWLLLAEGHLTRRLFGSMVRRLEALPVPTG